MNYEDLLPGKDWVENELSRIAEIYDKHIETRNWINPDQWQNEKQFGRGDVGLEVNIEGRKKVLIFKDMDLEDCLSTSQIQYRLLKYIKDQIV